MDIVVQLIITIAALLVFPAFHYAFEWAAQDDGSTPLAPLEVRLMGVLERHEDDAPDLVAEAREMADVLNPIPWCTHVRRLANGHDVSADVRAAILDA